MGAPIFHACKFFSEGIKTRYKEEDIRLFSRIFRGSKVFFHHMLIVVAPPPHLLPQKTSPHALLCHIGLKPVLPRTSHRLETIYQSRKSPQFLGDGHRKHDRSSSIFFSHSWYLFTRTDGRYTVSPKTPQVILSAAKSDGSFFSLDDLDGGGGLPLI